MESECQTKSLVISCDSDSIGIARDCLDATLSVVALVTAEGSPRALYLLQSENPIERPENRTKGVSGKVAIE
jgi:hypothetical protein